MSCCGIFVIFEIVLSWRFSNFEIRDLRLEICVKKFAEFENWINYFRKNNLRLVGLLWTGYCTSFFENWVFKNYKELAGTKMFVMSFFVKKQNYRILWLTFLNFLKTELFKKIDENEKRLFFHDFVSLKMLLLNCVYPSWKNIEKKSAKYWFA